MVYAETLFERAATPETYTLGQKAYWTHAVKRVAVSMNSRDQLVASGRVQGVQSYRAKFVLSPKRDRIDVFECSCPYDGKGPCEHVVALGLAAMFHEIPQASLHSVEEALEQGAAQKEEALPAPAHAIAERLQTLGVGLGKPAKTTVPKLRKKLHELTKVRLALSYDEGQDVVSLRVFLHYDDCVIPLETPFGSPQETWEVDGVIHVAGRDQLEEHRVFSDIRVRAGIQHDAKKGFFIEGEDIYWFLKETLAELEFRYEIEMGASMEPLLHLEQADIESDWTTKAASGEKWFDFSLQWHCASVDVSVQQLQDMVKSQRPFIRKPDGSFVECKNQDEVKRLVEFLERAEQGEDGVYRAPLFSAPEMLGLISLSRANRIAETNQVFETFLEEVKGGKPIEPVTLPAALDGQLRSYQKEGVDWAMFLRRYGFGGILADDMGLGKTLQVLALLSVTRKLDKTPSLVVCPKTLTLNWAAEVKKFTPEISVLVIDGTTEERAKLMEDIGKYDLVITSYSLLLRDVKKYTTLAQPFAYMILDEAQYVKNDRTATAKAVKLIPATYRLALTGTPLENGVQELWSIFDFLMPGFLGDAMRFRKRYEMPIHEHQDVRALEDLRRRIRPFMLRRTKDTHLKDLPPKIEQTSTCALTPEQLVVYTRTLEQVREDVFRAVQAKGFQRSRIEILSALTRLRRICDHPALVDPRLPKTEELSGKMALTMELVREATSGGHKVLIFSQFTSLLDILRTGLDESGIGHVTIEGRTRHRAEQVRKFEEDPKAQVFLLSLKAGGTGLTLTAADTVIMYDPWWNPLAERQAMDRAHRLGQTRTVNVYKLITKGTVEEKVVALQERKQRVFDAIMQEQPEALEALTWDELRGLFDFSPDA